MQIKANISAYISSYILLAVISLVEAVDKESYAPSLIITGFFLFTVVMIFLHCYLKRQQRKKFEDNLKRRSLHDRRTITNSDLISKSSVETMDTIELINHDEAL